jgi:hypothetical protein
MAESRILCTIADDHIKALRTGPSAAAALLCIAVSTI